MLTYNNSGSAYVDAHIYWADDNGDFDTGRYTQIITFWSRHLGAPYIGKFTTDSLDDIIMSIDNLHQSTGQFDTSYMALIKGGQQLYNKGKSALWDDTVLYGIPPYQGPHHDILQRFPFQGDWRGLGEKIFLQ